MCMAFKLSLLAWGTVARAQVPLKSIVAGIEAVEVVPGRSELIDEGQGFSVIVDAADTPEVGWVEGGSAHGA